MFLAWDSPAKAASRFFSVFVPAYLLIKLVSFQILIFIFGIPVFSLPFFSSVYPYFFSTVIRCFPHVCILPYLFSKVNNSNYYYFILSLLYKYDSFGPHGYDIPASPTVSGFQPVTTFLAISAWHVPKHFSLFSVTCRTCRR